DNLTVTFSNSSTDADGDALTFGWDFGDGNTSTDENPVHTYDFGGQYDVSLIVSDGDLLDTITQNVTVEEPTGDNPPVVGDIPDQVVNLGDEFTPFDLDDYLTELDGDEISWSYVIEGQEPEPGFAGTISASGSGNTYDMTFGFHPDATDGYDMGIDLYAPPAPPPPAFDAALGWEGDRYYAQILAWDGDYSEHEYDILLAYDTDNLITLSWDNTGWGDLMSSCELQDAFGGAMITVDMLTETELTLDNPAFTTLKLKVTPLPDAMSTRGVVVDIDGDNIVTVTYDDGWMGSETVNFTATDQTADMLSDSDDATFTVEEGEINEAPVAGFSWSADNLTVTFSNSSTDADGDALTFGWDFGDGNTSTDENPV
ncbi:MAG TPA: PKD domain-containing protein, partial [Candidatus Marinimicrobia bacterium]|nr:PKD domain-containing protein [Candidatus Neomarinimicrobiota bacterium]